MNQTYITLKENAFSVGSRTFARQFSIDYYDSSSLEPLLLLGYPKQIHDTITVSLDGV